jgi:hypothetical protein
MDRASQVLAQGVPPGVPRSYRALADYGNVSHSILHHCARGRPSIKEKANCPVTWHPAPIHPFTVTVRYW